MSDRDPAVLLDTHVWWWFATGNARLEKSPALREIQEAQNSNKIFISVISVWEIGMLESKGRLQLNQGVQSWIQMALTSPGVRLKELTASIAIESTRLPGVFHPDPADRILVATARELKVPIITADAEIIAYANQNYVKAVKV